VDYLKETIRSVRSNGLRGTFTIALNHVKRKTATYADWGFDRKHGIDTCALRSLNDLDVDEALKPALRGYEASPVRVIRAMLRSMPIDHSRFTFIDYGSGKGRVLLLASEYPYKKIIGVELSKALHDIAEANIQRWKSPSQKCHEIVSVNANAIEFGLPEGPLVLFFFTPFLEPVLAKVVDRIQAHVQAGADDIYIMYYGGRPELVAQFQRLGLQYKEIYSKHSILAVEKRTGRLFFRKV
jgi:SAM-dependent methyltransferase